MNRKLLLNKGILLFSLLLILTSGGNVFSQSNVVLHADFEGNDVAYGWDYSQACCSYSLASSAVVKRTGNKSMRVELRKTDSSIAFGKRAELIENSYPIPPDPNREWWSFSTYFPTDFLRDSVYEAIAQWQFTATGPVPVATSPPLSIQIFKGDLIVDLKYDSIDINLDKGANAKRKVFNLGPWEKGKWTDWIIQYHFSSENDGKLKIWKNGVVVLEYLGRNWYKGSYPPYFKLGIYKWPWNPGWNVPAEVSVTTSRVYFLDNVKIGNKEAILKDFLIPADLSSNVSPVANAGRNQLANFPVTYATISGLASYDPDGKIVSYKWTQESGPNQATMWASDSPVNKLTNLVPGKYLLRLTVKDSLGASSFSFVEVEARATGAINIPPVVNAGTTKEIRQPVNSVSLGGTASDSDGTIASYLWTMESGPSIASISSPNSQSTSVSNLTKGDYYFKLTAIDNSGGIGVGYVQVFVEGISGSDSAGGLNLPPVAVINEDQYITLPESTAILHGESSYDPDGSIVKYTWVQLSGPKSTPMISPAEGVTQITGLVEGVFTYRLYITDNKGLAGVSPVKTITVGPQIKPKLPNFSPVLILAKQSQSITLPENSVTLDASASYDPDGTIVRYAWVQLTGPKAAPMTTPAAPVTTINWLVEGTYTYKLFITDDSLVTVVSPTITVNVVSPAAVSSKRGTSPVVESAEVIAAPVNTLKGTAGKGELLVFPNPITNYLDLQLNTRHLGKGEIRIFDNQGRLLFKDQFIKNSAVFKKKLQLGRITAGYYLLDIKVGDKYFSREKLIKF